MPLEPHIPGLRRAVRLPGSRIERDVDDEIAFHLESRIRELIARGLPEETARRNAEAEFGDLGAARRELAALDRHRRRNERGARWLDATLQDFRQAVRSLCRSPGFTITAMLTLVIGIGATVACFALVNGVLLRPLPYGNPDRLVGAWHDLPSIGMMHEPQTAPMYLIYQQRARTIDGIGVYREGEVNVAEPGSAVEPERVTSAAVTATLMHVLQVSPLIGHAFTDANDRPGAPPVMLIAEGMWRARFSADPKVIGRTLEVNGLSRRIVGVMPARFQFPSAATRLWIPLQFDPANPPQNAFAYTAVARLKPGVTVADAQRDFASVLPRLPELYPNFVPGITARMMMDQMHPKPSLVPLKTDVSGGIAGTLWTVAGAGLLVLLVACANVANLIMVRAEAHQREIAVREALGAGRARVMLHFFTESAVLVAVAAALGLAVATVAVRTLVSAGPAGIPRLTEVKIDVSTVLFTIGVAAIVAISCSVVPAMRIGRGRLALREGGRSGTAGRTQHRVRGGLVVAQIALALVVLTGSGLLMRTFQRLHAVHPGFDPANVSTFWIALPPSSYKNDSSVVEFYSQLVDRIGALPGVRTVGLTSRLPLETHGIDPNPIYPEDDASFQTRLPPLQFLTAISDGYFRAMGIPIVAGRNFDRMAVQRDGDAIISLSTAQFFWKDSTGVAALGKRFRPLPTSPAYTVIGVVGDTRDSTLAAPPSQVVYFPETLEQGGVPVETKRTMALVVRMTSTGAPISRAVRQAVHDLDPGLPVFDARPMVEVLSAATARLTFIISLLGGAAVVTLMLGAVGLYGVLAYVVTLRRREMGIRIALGASPRAVATAMTRYGIGLAAVGITFGIVIFAVIARFLRSLLFGVATDDPLTIGASVLLLMVFAALASWAPARRAARVDPADALRVD